MMPWISAKATPGASLTRVVLLAGRRVGYCLAINEAEGKAMVLIARAREPGKRPRAMRYQGENVQAYVKAPFQFLEDPLGQRGAAFVPRENGWAYLTLKGWRDEVSRIIEQPWEISTE